MIKFKKYCGKSSLTQRRQKTSLCRLNVFPLFFQLSGLKIDLSQKRPPINYGAQELMIQQLQDEIKHLRGVGGDLSVGSDNSKPANVQVKNLQQKLKGAAQKITELAKERQQLIEIGNKLRAELKLAGKYWVLEL